MSYKLQTVHYSLFTVHCLNTPSVFRRGDIDFGSSGSQFVRSRRINRKKAIDRYQQNCRPEQCIKFYLFHRCVLLYS
jgi:hypothetical protein